MSDAAAQHARIKQLFMAAAELADDDARRQALDAADATTAEREAVQALLRADGCTTRFAQPVAEAANRWLSHDVQPGETLGAWRLGQPIGEGGMGRVFLAERADGAYRQQAAIKLLRRGLAPEAAARFAHERQILAGLDHPHIARLLDGGQTSLGQPFLVMEYVDGQRLDQWCNGQQLGLHARLTLLRTLCEAVAYAHRRLVIHCDLKPSNVLVDRDGRLRLLDFGIAHIDGDTDRGPAGLTPAYASPEQLRGEPPSVSSDVFSLGRLLQELMRRLPHGRERELNAVVACATHADPARRYADATALGQELRRLQVHLPVQALRGDRAYVLRKLLRRRWPWWLAGGAALLAATAFTWRLALERDRAQAAEQRAQQEARTAREVSDFLVNLFNDADANKHPRASELRALTLLERGHERLRRDLADSPQQRAPLLTRLGRVLENLGQTERATQLFREAIADYRQAGDRTALPELYNAYAFSLNRLGRYREALRAVQEWQTNAPPMDDEVAHIDNAFGTVLTNLGRTDEARVHLLRALASQGQDAHPRDAARLTPRARTYLSNLALVALAANQPAEAERLTRLALRPGEPISFRRHAILGLALMAQGRTEEALAEMALADAAAVSRYGELTGNRHRTLRDQGWVQLRAGQAAEAVRTLRLALRCAEEAGEAGHPLAAMTQARLAQALAATGDRVGAAQAFDEALRVAQALAADGDPLGLAWMQQAQADFIAAAR